MWSPPATQLHTSVPGREKGHCDGWEHHAREEAAWPVHSGQPAASAMNPLGHLWMWSGGNSTVRSSSHTSVTASTLHLGLFPYLLKVTQDRVQGMGSQQPLGAGDLISGWMQLHCWTGSSLMRILQSRGLRALPVLKQML